MAQHNDTGTWGENVACNFLIGKGYAIVQRNWRAEKLEIDIVAKVGNRIVFVEVKTRRDAESHPEDAVDKRRRARMVMAANVYLHAYDVDLDVQYDIVAITGTEHNYHIEHFEDAFFAPLRSYR